MFSTRKKVERIPIGDYIDIFNYIDDNFVDPDKEKSIETNQIKFSLKEKTTVRYALSIDENKSEKIENYVNLNIKQSQTFSSLLIEFIDKKGLKDSEVYNKAYIDRRLFSKIRNDEHYYPSKNTVFAFIMSLELDMTNAEKLLKSAGYSFNMSNKIDIIVKYFIENNKYSIDELNDALYTFNLQTI